MVSVSAGDPFHKSREIKEDEKDRMDSPFRFFLIFPGRSQCPGDFLTLKYYSNILQEV